MVKQTPFRDRYRGPWSVEATPSGYRVVAACGTALAYIYAPSGFDRAALTTSHLTPAEALALANAIAKLNPGPVEP